MRNPALALTAMVFMMAACTAGPAATATPSGSPAPSASPQATPSPSPAPTATPIGADPNVAVVKIEQVGGMLPPWMTLQFYPSVALYGDGRLILKGPEFEMYPAPALPNVVVTQVSQHGIQQVLEWAAEAGLQGEDRQLGEPILDSGVEVFTIVRPDGTHRTSVTNLAQADPAIAAAAQFQRLMLNLRQWLPDDVVGDDIPYEFDRLRIVSSPDDPAVVVGSDLANELDWPLEDLATLGQSLSEPAQYRCFVVEGEELVELRPLIQQANQLTLWNSGGDQYQLQLHPMLPDDEDCPGFF